MVAAIRVLAPLAAALALAVQPVTADPRYWWDDARLTNTPLRSVMPHVVVPGYAAGGPGGAGGRHFYVTWAEEDPVGGDLEIWMIASFDQGCSFCAPIRITANDVDDTNPKIAVLYLPTGTFSFAVAFESGGEVVLAWDSATASTRVPQDQYCAQIEAVGPAIISNDQYIRFGTGSTLAGSPSLCQSSTPLFGHFHLVWRQVQPSGASEILYAHDVDGRGGANWLVTPPKLLPVPDFGSDGLEPAIACEVATDPHPVTGTQTNDRSAPNVIFVELMPTDQTRLAGLRSTDSGFTFSPTGMPPDAAAAPVADPCAGPAQPQSRPAIDAGTNSISTTAPSWLLMAYDDARTAPDLVRADARHVHDAVQFDVDWQADDDVSTGTRPGDGIPACSSALPGQAWIAWQDSRFGAREIVYHAGWLDPAAPDPFDLSRFVYAPQRPLDVVIGGDQQLTHCAFDEATFACSPTRSTGDATAISIDSNELATYAAWVDTRDGNQEIYWKRTDFRTPAGLPPRLATGCGPAGDAWIDVEFDPLGGCPTSAERLRRYMIFYGQVSGGPFVNAAAPIVVEHATATSPSTMRIAGLLPGTRYFVVLVPEDEGRNVDPAGFDPAAAATRALANERSITTESPCVAPETCLWRGDVTQLWPHVPARDQIYLVPPSGDDIHVQGPAYQCPIATGDLERDPGALFDGVALVLYQVNQPIATLRLSKSVTTIRFTF